MGGRLFARASVCVIYERCGQHVPSDLNHICLSVCFVSLYVAVSSLYVSHGHSLSNGQHKLCNKRVWERRAPAWSHLITFGVCTIQLFCIVFPFGFVVTSPGLLLAFFSPLSSHISSVLEGAVLSNKHRIDMESPTVIGKRSDTGHTLRPNTVAVLNI